MRKLVAAMLVTMARLGQNPTASVLADVRKTPLPVTRVHEVSAPRTPRTPGKPGHEQVVRTVPIQISHRGMSGVVSFAAAVVQRVVGDLLVRVVRLEASLFVAEPDDLLFACMRRAQDVENSVACRDPAAWSA